MNILQLGIAAAVVAMIFMFPGFFLGLLLLILAAALVIAVLSAAYVGVKALSDAIDAWWKKPSPRMRAVATTAVPPPPAMDHAPAAAAPPPSLAEAIEPDPLLAEPLTAAEEWLSTRLGYVIRNGKYLSGIPALRVHVLDTRSLLDAYYCCASSELRDAAYLRAFGCMRLSDAVFREGGALPVCHTAPGVRLSA
jgi:hypothetical protein